MQRRRLLRALAAAAGALPLAARPSLILAQDRGGEARLPQIDDLRTIARQVRRERSPLLLFFSTPGCPYCIEVRRSYLAPRLAAPDGGGVLIREVSITSSRSFIGLDGRPMTDRDLAAYFLVGAVPVVRLVDAELKPLADPLVGLSADFYESYLQTAIDTARKALSTRKADPRPA